MCECSPKCWYRKRASMWFLLFLFALASANFVVNKCCSDGKILQLVDEKARCVDANFNVTSWSWFPIEALMYSQNFSNVDEATVQTIKRDSVIRFKFPSCEEYPQNKVAFFANVTGRKGFFLFVTGENNFSLRTYVAENDSFYYPEDMISFDGPQKEIRKTQTFSMTDVCMDSFVEKDIFMMLYCPCNSMLCIKKCCSTHEFFNDSSQSCQSMPKEMDFPSKPKSVRLIKFNITNFLLKDSLDNIFVLVSSKPTCNNSESRELLKSVYLSYNQNRDVEFNFLPNGSIETNGHDRRLFHRDQYCGESSWHSGNQSFQQSIFICSSVPQNDLGIQQWEIDLFGLLIELQVLLLVVSIICLVATIVISLILPELHKKKHNKMVLTQISCILTAYFVDITRSLVVIPDIIAIRCLLTLLYQVSILGSYFWLTAISVDICFTIGSLMGRISNMSYTSCSLYVWSCIFLITIVNFVMEFCSDVVNPGQCSPYSNLATICTDGPIALLFLINLVLYTYTAVNLMLVQRQTACLHERDSSITSRGSSLQTHKKRLLVYTKLFFVMGLTWIVPAIIYLAGFISYYYIIFQLLNFTRNILLFVIVICKKSILIKLKRKLFG